MDSSISMNTNFSKPSDFYFACRNNEINNVREYLKTLTAAEINRLEPNGSTPLHAAAYNGHIDIVKILLEHGGTSRSTLNKYDLTAYDEAKTDEIKKLFARSNCDRFVGNVDVQNDVVEWMRCDSNVEKAAIQQRYIYQFWGWEYFKQYFNIIKRHYVKRYLNISNGSEVIDYFLGKGKDEENPEYFIRAYRAETDFYRKMNKDLAVNYHCDDQVLCGRRYILHMLWFHPAFDHLSFKGKVYRGMLITEADLVQYAEDTSIMNQAFMPTTKDRRIAESFISGERIPDGKLSALCTYEIRKTRTGLDIETLSEYPHERGVLILPRSAFKVVKIRRSGAYIEIELQECKSFLRDWWIQFQYKHHINKPSISIVEKGQDSDKLSNILTIGIPPTIRNWDSDAADDQND